MWSKGTLSLEIGFGVSVFSDQSDTGNPDSSWPNSDVEVSLSPEASFVIPVSSFISGIISLRADFYLSELEDNNPFKSGLVALIGLQFGEN